MERFVSERALSELFLSDWYVASMHLTQLHHNEREILEEIAEETAQQEAGAERAFAEWQSRMAPEDVERLATFDAEMLHVARQGFLKLLIEAKDASGTFYQKAALTAPRDLADRFAQMGATDFEHAMRLRKMMIDLFYGDSPLPRIQAGELGLKP